jgi:hypothetical protein
MLLTGFAMHPYSVGQPLLTAFWQEDLSSNPKVLHSIAVSIQEECSSL